MSNSNLPIDLGIASRIRRSQGRYARNAIASIKVTRDERAELEKAAGASGQALSEWGRDVLLRRARSGNAEDAMLTELIALRMLTSTVLRSIAIGQSLTPEAYAQILTEVKTSKHEAARDVLRQYTKSPKEK